jgi:lysozyme family protein
VTPEAEVIIEQLISREGGYVNHPADRGGATMYGITEAVARANGYKGPMGSMQHTVAEDIYFRIYWERPGFNLVAELAPKLAAELLDTAVNMGPSVASTFLQRALTALNRNGRDYPDLVPDGRIGPATIAALRRFLAVRGMGSGEVVLLKAVESLQGERYLALAERRPANEAFLYGWLANRVGDAL